VWTASRRATPGSPKKRATQYTLGYYTHQPVIDTRFRKIEVRLERSGMEVIAKTGYKTSGEDQH
jgi:hypothetical protein